MFDGAMYIDVVPNRGSRPAVLLRRTRREGGKIVKETVANLSDLEPHQVEQIRRTLKGELLAPVESLFDVVESRQHGNAQAVTIAMERLGMARLLDRSSSRQRNLVLAMIGARILNPQSKLSTARTLESTTLPQQLGLESVDEDGLYSAMDWLLERQDVIEARLAKRHLVDGGLALFDLSSTYFEGSTCPLAKLGYSRDGKEGTLQVNFGVLTDRAGRPVSVSVFPGNAADPTTLIPQAEKLQSTFGLEHIVLVGDRGMITQHQIQTLAKRGGIDWITAVRTETIKKLMVSGQLQLGLFDERNIFETTHPDYAGERLIACRNIDLGKLRAQKRETLLVATEKALEKIATRVTSGRLKGKDEIGVHVGRVINKYRMAKHIIYTIEDGQFTFTRNTESIHQESLLDGVYVVRTSLQSSQMDTNQTVLAYKKLSEVERAFRAIKTIDLHIRPIHHRLETRVRAHIFLCMLAYYVEWHMLQAWRPLLFADEHVDAKNHRDPVAAAQPSPEAKAKAQTLTTTDKRFPVHSFRTLLDLLGRVVRNTCRVQNAPPESRAIFMDTRPTEHQGEALRLMSEIHI
jgi:transposase